jgi:hypothetical protein
LDWDLLTDFAEFESLAAVLQKTIQRWSQYLNQVNNVKQCFGGAKQRRSGLISTAIVMNAPSSLCPGYKQVEAFGPEEEYEDDEEVSYVVLDLGNAEPTLVPTSSTYRLIVSSLVLV